MAGADPDRSSRIQRCFFDRPTLDVARSLLGMRLVRRLRGRRLAGRIVETEAYVGDGDSACHASRGLTERNRAMFGLPGRAYVYFTYGMHWMFNVVTEQEGFPAAVLIRALEPLDGIDVMQRHRSGRGVLELAAGPARLCQALAIDGSLYGADLVEGGALFLERGTELEDGDVGTSSRVGIRYAADRDILAPWRFFAAASPYVSRGRPSSPDGASRRRSVRRGRRRREGS